MELGSLCKSFNIPVSSWRVLNKTHVVINVHLLEKSVRIPIGIDNRNEQGF